MKKNNKKVLRWIFGCSKRYIPIIIIISLLAAAVSLETVMLAMISKSVLEIATGDKTGSFLYYGILMAVLVVSHVLCTGLESYLRSRTSGKFIVSLRKRLFDAICRRNYFEISKYHSGDLLNRLTGDIDVLQNSVISIIPTAVSMVTKIVGCIVALVLLEPKVALLILVVGVVIPTLGRFFSRRLKYLYKESQRTEGVSRSFMQECFENLSVMKTFKTKEIISKRLDAYLKDNYNWKIKRAIVSIAMHLGLYTVFTVGYYAVLLWGAIQISAPDVVFTYGTLTAFLQLVSQVKAPLQNISSVLPQYYAALASAERLMAIEELGEEKLPVDDEKLQEIYDGFKFISVENISFGYGDGEILQNVSCRIDRGSMTAILGDSGTGKSTLFKLLLSLYQPQSGKITINGDLPIDASVRAIFSYVPQGNMIISGSIRENIAMCNPVVSEEEIISACKIAEIYDYIATLPNGLDTELSERGSGLSEGQLQRIAIARALVADTPILLLDEATSALDKPTEAKVLRNIKELSDKTVISVTHRTSNLNLCDNIINLTEMKL